MRAVIFDLWDTLVDWPHEEWGRVRRGMAKRLGLEHERFEELWNDTYRLRQTGSLAEALRVVGADDEAVEELRTLRLEFTRGGLVPRPGAVETLEALRERGLRVGLISVCTEEVPALWGSTPFAGLVDVAVFSAECGLMKPDREIYLHACERLGVQPQECLYVGDGANDELEGARRVGMTPVLIHRDGREPFWESARRFDGLHITSIPQVLDLVAAADGSL